MAAVVRTGGGGASGGSSGSGTVGIGTTGRFVIQIGTTTTGTPYNINADSNGNVGIGSAAPGQKLSVQGSIEANNKFVGNQQTASAPTYSFTTDSNTGMWSTGADYLNFATGGTDRMFIGDGGNVGIGTTNTYEPVNGIQQRMAIRCAVNGDLCGSYIENTGTGASTTYTLFRNTQATGNTKFAVVSAGGSFNLLSYGGSATGTAGGSNNAGNNFAMASAGNLILGTGTGAYASFAINNTEKMRLDTTGNLGVGTTNPGTLLDVQGTTRQTGFVLTGNGAASGFMLQASGTQGIGTWVPAPTGGGSGTVNSATVNQIARYASTGTAVSGSTLVYDDLTNVGIGTVVPQSKLDVAGSDAGVTLTSASVAMHSVINTNTTVNNFEDVAFGMGTSTGAIKIGGKIAGVNTVHTNGSESLDMAFLTTNAGTAGERIRILAGGNVGIGTNNPTQKLQINATALPFTVDSNSNVGIGTNIISNGALLVMNGNVGIGTWKPAGALDIKTGNNVLIQTGNVGIGSLSPGQALDVNGAIRSIASGVSTFNGNVGIGTTLNTNFLDVAGGVTIGTTYAGYQVAPANGVIVQGNVGINTSAPGAFNLEVNGTVRVVNTNSIGWSVVAGANTACNTTCTSGCVFGEDTSVIGTIVACTDATADVCVCAGGS